MPANKPRLFSLSSAIIVVAALSASAVLTAQSPAQSPAQGQAQSQAQGDGRSVAKPAGKPASPAAAANPAPARAAVLTDAVRAAVAQRIPGVKPDDVKVSLVPGVFEVARGAEIFYVTADARYVFAGDLYDLESEQNLSERRRREARTALLATVPESQMIIFGPRDAKYTVTVFTDIDCGFCRKLHAEIAKYNDLGIRVRYMFYPRTGPNTESWQKAVSVWCAKDRNDAFTRAKRGEAVADARCGKTPVDRDYEIGQDIVVTGTPAIVLSNGEMVAGYRAAPALLKLAQAANRP